MRKSGLGDLVKAAALGTRRRRRLGLRKIFFWGWGRNSGPSSAWTTAVNPQSLYIARQIGPKQHRGTIGLNFTICWQRGRHATSRVSEFNDHHSKIAINAEARIGRTNFRGFGARYGPDNIISGSDRR